MMRMPRTSADAGEVEGVSHDALTDRESATAAGQDVGTPQTRRLEQRALFRLLARAVAELNDIVIVTDAESLDEPGPRIVYVNAAFERRLGYTADEAIGRTPRFLQGPATERAPLDRIRRALSARQPVREEVVNYTKAGELIHLELEIAPMFSASGRCTHFVAIERNISERRAAEEQLSLLATALDSVASSVVILQPDARIRWVNRAFTELSGYDSTEAVGQHITRLLQPSPVESTPQHGLWAALANGDAWSGEVAHDRKDGGSYPAHLTITPVRGANGRNHHFVGLARDLTETRLQEAHLLRTQRVENIGMLASGIAHDLNNVLAPILLSVDFLRATETDPDRRETLAQMEDSTKRGASLLRRLLLFARGMDGQRVPLSVREYVQEVAAIARSTFPRSITVQVQVDMVNDLMLADPTQVHQLLMNLCVNARDAMADGGTLTIEATSQVVDEVFAQMHPLAVPGRYVVFRVADTGCGMSADVQARILEPFYTTKPTGEGTGLGLSTVVAILQGHGGFLRVESTVDQGSTFTAFLPADVDATVGEITESTLPDVPRGNGELVLLVDDEALIRAVAQRALERFGYRVLTAEHGAAAVAQFARNGREIAVVVVDMLMPVLDGVATILALKALDPEVRIVISSGVATPYHAEQAARAGVKHFVQKPFAASELVRVLADCLRGRRSDTA